jgi:hypothetical protein
MEELLKKVYSYFRDNSVIGIVGFADELKLGVYECNLIGRESAFLNIMTKTKSFS